MAPGVLCPCRTRDSNDQPRYWKHDFAEASLCHQPATGFPESSQHTSLRPWMVSDHRKSLIYVAGCARIYSQLDHGRVPKRAILIAFTSFNWEQLPSATWSNLARENTVTISWRAENDQRPVDIGGTTYNSNVQLRAPKGDWIILGPSIPHFCWFWFDPHADWCFQLIQKSYQSWVEGSPKMTPPTGYSPVSIHFMPRCWATISQLIFGYGLKWLIPQKCLPTNRNLRLLEPHLYQCS